MSNIQQLGSKFWSIKYTKDKLYLEQLVKQGVPIKEARQLAYKHQYAYQKSDAAKRKKQTTEYKEKAKLYQQKRYQSLTQEQKDIALQKRRDQRALNKQIMQDKQILQVLPDAQSYDHSPMTCDHMTFDTFNVIQQ